MTQRRLNTKYGSEIWAQDIEPQNWIPSPQGRENSHSMIYSRVLAQFCPIPSDMYVYIIIYIYMGNATFIDDLHCISKLAEGSFRSQTSDNMDRWKKQRWEESEKKEKRREEKRKRRGREEKRREEKRWEERRREEKRREKVREKVREEQESEERRCRCAKR